MSTNREADILEAMQFASLDESRRLTAELDQIRAEAALDAQADRDWDASNAIIEDHLTPVLVHGMHSTATDWLDEQVPDFGESDLGTVANTMRTEASVWYASLNPAVKADRDELREQARGTARRLGSQYGSIAAQASSTFMEYVGRLVQAEGTDMGNIPSAADGKTNPQLDPWSDQPVVDGASHSEGSPPETAAAPDASPEGGIPAAPAAPAPASSSAGEPTDTAPSAENHSKPEDTHNNPGNAADTTAPVKAAAYETAQQRAIRQYFATEEGSEFPVPGEVDPEQDGEAQSSLPVGVDVAGHPDTFPNFVDPVAPKPAPSTRAPNMTGSRHQAVSTGPNPQGSFIYDPIKVEAKGYEEGFAYALTWAPGKPVPAALTSAATIGNKYNAQYVDGYRSGFEEGIEALSPEFQTAYLAAHKQQVLATRKEALPKGTVRCGHCGGSGQGEFINGKTKKGQAPQMGHYAPCPGCSGKGYYKLSSKEASPNTLQFDDENQAEAFPYTWSTEGGGGKGAADVANVPTPGSEVANYPQPSNASQGEAAVGDTSTEIDPIIDEEPGDAHGNPEKLAQVRATVRRRLGFSVRADDRPVVDIYDEALYKALDEGKSMEEAAEYAEKVVERTASKKTAAINASKTAGAYGDTGPHQSDWDQRITELHKVHDACPHCKGAKTRTGDAEAICGPHRDSMRAQYATHPASESYWTSSKHTAWDKSDNDAEEGSDEWDEDGTPQARKDADDAQSKTAADLDGYKACKSCGRMLSQGEGGDPPLDENGICDDCNDPYSDSKRASKTAETFGDQYYDPNGKPCSVCGRGMNNLSEFPGDKCISCHANSPEGRYIPTADEMSRMWGGPGVVSSKTALDRDAHNWDTGEVALHFDNDYTLYSATRGGWASPDDLRTLWNDGHFNDTVDTDAVDWQAVADQVNDDEDE